MIDSVEKAIGWNTLAFAGKSLKNRLLKSSSFEVFELNSGEIIYFAKIPAFTLQEAKLLRKITKKFQETHSKKSSKELELFLEDYCVENSIFLDSEQIDYFLKTLNSSIFGFSALDCFLEDSKIEEIAVIGIGIAKPVFVFHKKFGWLKTNIFFGKSSAIKNIANKMAQDIGRRLTLECPKLNANLPDGSRLTATMPPISKEPSLTIRKFRAEPFTPADLVENKTFSLDFCAFIWIALELECSFLIAGNTGSGKTSTMNCLLAFVPKHERMIIVEETPEIVLPHEHCLKLGTVKEQGFGMHSLIIETLRMRPDRIIVGEIRNREETISFMDTLLAGQGKGSYATFHAQSAKEAIARLKSFGISEIDLASIDLLLVQRRWAENEKSRLEKRRIVEASEIFFEENRLQAKPLFEFDFKSDSLKIMGESEKVLGKARDFWGVGRKEFNEEICKRKNLLQNFVKKGKKMREFFAEINKSGKHG